MNYKKTDVALIVGGTSGLGKQTAKILLSLGLTVVITGRCKRKGKEVSEEIGATFCQMDVCDYQSVENCFDTALNNDLTLRIMVNCAGFSPAKRIISKGQAHDAKLFSEVINTNLLGALYCASLAATLIAKSDPIDPDKQRGIIINTSSTAAFDGQIGQVAYAASKGGINAMTLPMARDLASHGIRVCTIAPGLFNTPLVSALDSKIKLSIQDQTPFPRRFGTPNEFALTVRHIIENTMLNGEIIRLDGGLRMSVN